MCGGRLAQGGSQSAYPKQLASSIPPLLAIGQVEPAVRNITEWSPGSEVGYTAKVKWGALLMVMARFEGLSVVSPDVPEMYGANGNGHDAGADPDQDAFAEAFRGLSEERREFIGAFGRLLYDATLEQVHEPYMRFQAEVFRSEALRKDEKLRHPEWGRQWQSVVTAYDAAGNQIGREGLIDGRLHRIGLHHAYRQDQADGRRGLFLPETPFWCSAEVEAADLSADSYWKAEAALVAEKADYAELERDLRNAELNEVLAYWLAKRRTLRPSLPEQRVRFAGLRRRLGLAAAEGSDTLVQP